MRGISRMVAENKYCIDILTQVNAVKAALDQVVLLLLEGHVKGCGGCCEGRADGLPSESPWVSRADGDGIDDGSGRPGLRYYR